MVHLELSLDAKIFIETYAQSFEEDQISVLVMERWYQHVYGNTSTGWIVGI